MTSIADNSSEVDPILTAESFAAEASYASQHPEEFSDRWLELCRTDPELAKVLLSGAKHASESGRPSGEIYVETATLMMAAMERQREGSRLEKQIPVNVEPQEVAEDKKRHLRLRRLKKDNDNEVRRKRGVLRGTLAASIALISLRGSSKIPSEEV